MCIRDRNNIAVMYDCLKQAVNVIQNSRVSTTTVTATNTNTGVSTANVKPATTTTSSSSSSTTGNQANTISQTSTTTKSVTGSETASSSSSSVNVPQYVSTNLRFGPAGSYQSTIDIIHQYLMTYYSSTCLLYTSRCV